VAGRIPQSFIDDLIQRADIAEIVGTRVKLKKAGREYKACCPFHSEKTPSFTVSPQKGFYHCFGCGAHGTVVGFLMEYDRLEFVEAVEELAQQLGLEVPRAESTERQAPIAPVFDTLTDAARLFRQALKEHQAAIDYLKTRGLDGETVHAFGIGYAPASWDFLMRRLGGSEEADSRLTSAGLILPRDGGGYYDRFRDRVMFPIRDGRGRVVGFGGRVLGAGEPKYLNSPETAVFHKGRELYGLFEARRANRSLDHAVVVEGYMDVVSLACHGVSNAVATLGTATTPEHLRRLFRATQQIIFCFDGDRAGRAAAWRALQTSLAEMRDGRQVRFLFLDERDDPDSVVRREGAEGWRTRLTGAMPLSEYFFAELAQQTDIGTMDGRARLAELARPLLSELPRGVYRELLTERLAGEVGMSQSRLESLLQGGAPAPQKPPTGRRPSRSRPSLVRQALRLLLNFPELGAALDRPAGLDAADQRGVPLLLEVLEITARKPDISSAGVLERFRDRPEGRHLEALLTEEVLIGPDAAARELEDSLARIVAAAEQQRLAALISKAAETGLAAHEKEELRRLRRRSDENGDIT
jgi:DNA primase